MDILVGAVHPPSLCYGAAARTGFGEVGAVHLNRLRRLGSIAATCGNFGDCGQSPLPDWVNRRYLQICACHSCSFV